MLDKNMNQCKWFYVCASERQLGKDTLSTRQITEKSDQIPTMAAEINTERKLRYEFSFPVQIHYSKCIKLQFTPLHTTYLKAKSVAEPR